MDSETITIIVSFLSAATVALNMWTSKNKINKIENDRQKQSIFETNNLKTHYLEFLFWKNSIKI